ncbi:MAG TPA: AcrB/AcrD/AcrF family protein, partial [Myxococcales bacterium]|nr:AcrB/AcrD/AcrF family protein [Myxococcales bacterium]
MGISSLAVRRGVTFAMLYIIIVGFGGFSLLQLKLDLFPDIKFPIIAIINSYSGVSPEEMETLVTRPMEMAISSVKNVKKISSTSKFGNAVVMVELEWGTDIDKAMLDIREKLDLFKKRLPEEARQPLLFAFDPSLQPILILSVTGSGNPIKLREYIEQRITPMFERVEGVASARIDGGKKRDIQILVDPLKLQLLGIPLGNIVKALQADNVQVASGSIRQTRKEFAIRTVGMFKTIDQIGKVVIGFKGRPVPQPIYLSQVAKIKDTHEDPSRLIRADGKEGMLLLVQKRSGANTVQTANRLLKKLPEIQRQLPQGSQFGILFNQSDFIKSSLNNLTNSAGQAFFLAVLVLLFFLRSVRGSLIIAMSIPVSVISTFATMYFADVSLNIISMAGLALAVGMLVDNSIVVLENIFRHFEEKDSAWEAAIQGSQEVVLAITASTLTTLAVFVPILFVPGLAGMLFRDMVITICFSLTASLVVAVTLIPLLASRMLKIKPKDPDSVNKSHDEILDESVMKGWVGRTYATTLDWTLQNRKKTLAFAILMFFASLGLGQFVKAEFIPKSDDGQVMIQYELAPGTSLTKTIKTAAQIENILKTKFNHTIRTVVGEAGSGEGFSGLFGKGSHAGMVRVRLKEPSKRPLNKTDFQEALRGELQKIPGLKFSFMGGGAVFASGGDIDIQLYGHDLVKARELAEAIKQKVRKIKGTSDVTTSLEEGQPELQVHFRRERLRVLGLNAYTVGSTISTAFKGTIASLYRQGDNEYPITVRLQGRYRQRANQLKRLSIFTPQGKAIPLNSIATIRYALSPVKIERLNQQRMATVSITVPRSNLSGVTARVRKMMEKETMPEGFSYKITGAAEDLASSFMYLGIAFLISIILVYMVMASQFESLFEPFVILFSIPLSIIGVMLALVLTGTSLSVMGLIGIVMLVGIVVNNAI